MIGNIQILYMGKRLILISTVLLLLISIVSCAKSDPVNVVEYAQVCDAANKGKTVTVEGFLSFGNKTPCVSMLRGNMKRDCGFKLLDRINVVGEEILVYLREGRGNNQVETPDTDRENVKPSAGFENEQVKLRLNDGTVVSGQKDAATPAAVTGEVIINESNGGKGCSILADKIEKR